MSFFVDFASCFGSQIEQFCSVCTSNNSVSQCSGCFPGFILTGTTCSYDSIVEKFAPRKIKIAACCRPLQFRDPLTELCKCPLSTWVSNTGDCMTYPQNCLEVQDITGICTKASDGYYINSLNEVRSCQTDIPGCGICEYLGGSPSCSLCLSTGTLTSIQPRNCKCGGMEWYNSSGVCVQPVENCIEKQNIQGCRLCKGNGSLSGTTPQQCVPPICLESQSLRADWTCK